MIDVVDKERQALDPKLKGLIDQESEEEKDFIYCGTCSSIIGRRTDRIDVNGSHDHRFTNPYGYQYHIGCFAEALGCSLSGAPEAADTWFYGYFWRLAACGDCQRHIGWYFDGANADSGNRFFYGLILDRIQYE